jgi:hypothetical protein
LRGGRPPPPPRNYLHSRARPFSLLPDPIRLIPPSLPPQRPPQVELRQFFRDVEWQSASLAPALRRIRAVTRGGKIGGPGAPSAAPGGGPTVSPAAAALAALPCTLSELVAAVEPVTLWEIEADAEVGVRANVLWGIYSFVLAIEHARGRDSPTVVLARTMRALLTDAKTRIRALMRDIFLAILLPGLREEAVRTLGPSLRADLSGSVAWGAAGFAVVPGPTAANPLPPAAAAAAAAPAADAATADTDAGAAAVPAPAPAAPVKVLATAAGGSRQKVKAAAEADVAAATATPQLAADFFIDADWIFTSALCEALDAAVSGDGGMGAEGGAEGVAASIRVVVDQLDKLHAKLGVA